MVNANKPTLVVDLDGTLTATDTLAESILILIQRRPLAIFAMLLWLLAGRAAFKAHVMKEIEFDVGRLPWREDFVAWLQEERRAGRRLVLATAAHEKIAGEVARALPIFDAVLASDAANNLKGEAKLAAIRRLVGDDFVYAGDSRADLPVWAAARGAVLVGTGRRVADAARALTSVEREFPRAPRSWRLWLQAVRAHQWVKNLLLFVPLFTSFSFGDPFKFFAVIGAFIAFSLTASATYLMNDLSDLDSDRRHPRKRYRPLASAALPIGHGVLGAAVMMSAGLLGALAASPRFAAAVMGYVVMTTAYSWVLKRYVLIDVLALAFLYTYRVLAGALVVDLRVTPWLLAFSMFTFLSLALVKRCAELVQLGEQGKTATRGRDYRVSDLVVLWPLGVGASLCAVVVFGLYLGSPEALIAYGDTSLMWLVGIGLIYWMARMWIKAARSEMHDDPVVFAIKDRGSRIAVLAMSVVPVFVHFTK